MSTTKLNVSTSVLVTKTYNGSFDDLALRRELCTNLVGFSRYLHQYGMNTGLSEQMDVIQALDTLDLKNEITFKMGLRTTSAKSVEEQDIFDEHFHSYWYLRECIENLHQRLNSQ